MRSCIPAVTLLVVAAGCDVADSNSGPFGSPQPSKLLQPFAGVWVCDDDATIKLDQEAGASEAQLKGYELARKINGGKLHSDITITGNCIHYGDALNAEYYLFGLHQHGDYACGKAWHHEDRHDPGDMSKCYVRLKLKGDLLYLETKMQDGNPELSDGDIDTQKIEAGSAATCTAEMPPGEDWSDWSTLVFRRK
jgi:hypothetical protein